MSEKWSMEFFQHQEEWTNSQHGLQKNNLKIAQKHDKTYSKTLNWIRCKLSYSCTLALNSYVPKRSKISIHHPTTSPDTVDLACHECWVPLH